jgi:hypothetical protein
VQWNKTYSTIALAKSAMERIPLHSWEMEFSVQYHATINSQAHCMKRLSKHIFFKIEILPLLAIKQPYFLDQWGDHPYTQAPALI